MTENTKWYKALFTASKIFIVPGVFDGYDVRLDEVSVFKFAAIPDASDSASHLGWADRGIISYKDNLEASRPITAWTDLSDAGYGNPTSVHFTYVDSRMLACLAS